LKTPQQAECHPESLVTFFTSIGFAPMGGIGRIKHPKGELGRLLVEVFNILPARLKTG
jgi:hypothetical protein